MPRDRVRLDRDLAYIIRQYKDADRLDELREKLSISPTPPPVDSSEWIYLDKNYEDCPTRQELSDLAKSHQDIRERISSEQSDAAIRFDTDQEWIGICFSADWHFGSVACDYDELNRHIDNVLETDNIYLITVGDLLDNFKTFGSLRPILTQAMPPDLQRQWLLSTLQELASACKWLAATWGNHDNERDEKLFGESWLAEALGKQFVYFAGKGVLSLEFPKSQYEIAMSHYFRGHSMHNPTHSQGRAKKEQYPTADCIVAGHRHNFAYSWYQQYPHLPPCHLIQLGTFQGADDYGNRYFRKGQQGAPVVLFNTRRKESLFVQSIEQAKRFMQAPL